MSHTNHINPILVSCVRFTCPECLEGMELVGAYMTDPLWISEYTVYLEQNFCVGHNDHHCVDMVRCYYNMRQI